LAYIQNQDEEKKNSSTQPGPTAESGSLLSSGGGVQPGQNKKQNFATLQSYLSTNKPQGEQFANKLAQGISETGQKAQEGITQTGQKLSSDIQGQTVNYNPDVVKNATANPTEFVKNPENLNQFTSYRTAAYNGPGTAQETPEFQQTQSDVAKAQERAQLTESEGGRKQLASEAQKSQAGGITALNQALLSTNPNATSTLRNATAPFTNLQTSLGATADQVNARIQAAKEAAQRTSSESEQALTTKLSDFNKDLQTRLGAAAENRTVSNQEIQAINQKIMNGETLSPDELSKLGVDPTAYKKAEDLYSKMKSVYGDRSEGRTPTTYFTPGAPSSAVPELGTLATSQDYDTEAALEALTGEQLGILQNEQRPQAGTYQGANNYGKYDVGKQFEGVKGAYKTADAGYLHQNLNPQDPNVPGLGNDPAAIANYTLWAATQGPAAASWAKLPNYNQIVETAQRVLNDTY
jgi:hypothetical protein